VCMPIQGALNAIVYGWSLPSIRDVYRTMLLGTEAVDAHRDLQVVPSDGSLASNGSGVYSPPSLYGFSDRHAMGGSTPDSPSANEQILLAAATRAASEQARGNGWRRHE
jgi:hypothetical protein